MDDNMRNIEWLESRLRSVGRINTKGQTEDDGMWVASLVLNLHFTVQIKANTLAEIISKGKEYELNKNHDRNTDGARFKGVVKNVSTTTTTG